MKLLAWDTSTKVGSIAALEWDETIKGARPHCVSEWTLNVENSFHSERLLWGVHYLLESARWKLEDVDVFAVGVGPGSFTGLRIGITTARTLAHTLQKPLVPISSLAALARPVADFLDAAAKGTLLITANDACKGEVYALWGTAGSVRDCVSKSENDRPGLWKRGVEEQVIAPEKLHAEIAKKLKASPTLKWAWQGNGNEVYPEITEGWPLKREIKIPSVGYDFVQGKFVGVLGWEAIQAGLVFDALSVHPRYLRASDAEIKRAAGLLKP